MHSAKSIHKGIVGGVHRARYRVGEDDTNKHAISISQAWLVELQMHPYHSSKSLILILVEKPCTGIFLMKM